MFGLVVMIGLAAVVGNQMGLLEPYKERFGIQESQQIPEESVIAELPAPEAVIEEEPPGAEPVVE